MSLKLNNVKSDVIFHIWLFFSIIVPHLSWPFDFKIVRRSIHFINFRFSLKRKCEFVQKFPVAHLLTFTVDRRDFWPFVRYNGYITISVVFHLYKNLTQKKPLKWSCNGIRNNAKAWIMVTYKPNFDNLIRISTSLNVKSIDLKFNMQKCW